MKFLIRLEKPNFFFHKRVLRNRSKYIILAKLVLLNLILILSSLFNNLINPSFILIARFIQINSVSITNPPQHFFCSMPVNFLILIIRIASLSLIHIRKLALNNFFNLITDPIFDLFCFLIR